MCLRYKHAGAHSSGSSSPSRAASFTFDVLVLEVGVACHRDGKVTPGHAAVDAQHQQRLILGIELLAQVPRVVFHCGPLIRRESHCAAFDGVRPRQD
jgi:hypothetical protein